MTRSFLAICAAAAITLAPAVSMAQSKQRIYDSSGIFIGTIEQLPGGSQKQGVYNALGVRIGTIEHLPGSNKLAIIGPNGTVGRTIEPDPFSSKNSDDPFATPSVDDSE